MTIGTLCFIDKISPRSMNLYKRYKKTFSYFICPCSIPLTQKLEVQQVLPNDVVLVSYYKENTSLSILSEEDLKK